jgi:hypothetical protein
VGVAYIIRSQKHDLRLDPHYFVEQLRNRWLNVEVHVITDPRAHSVFQWHLTMDDGAFLLGDFNEQGISYEVSGLANVANFALWYRVLVPSEHMLVLYKSSLTHKPIQLVKETILEDILAGFNVPFDLNEYD